VKKDINLKFKVDLASLEHIGFANEILPVEVRQIPLDEVYGADEVFLSASTKRISPVTDIDGHTFASGPFTKMIYDRLVEEERR
jgi:branched-subunit amino acid aminotransferase/4-amino-4-deoxychorismate lyase